MEVGDMNESRESNSDSNIFYKDEAYAIQGAVYEVSREMGIGFLEAVYQECLAKEFAGSGVPFEAEKMLSLTYKGEHLTQTYQPDFICFEKIVVELKCVRELRAEHRAQVLNYLKATGFKLGLLVNFGRFPKAEVERLVF
jgi:GxxExxY protein